MMKAFVLALFVASAFSAPNGYGSSSPVISSEFKSLKPVVPILKMDVNNDNEGNYNVAVQTGDGTSSSESGSLKKISADETANTKSGSVSYTSPEGQALTLTYTADENGFHASGAHLPTSPPMPEEIRKSLLLPRDPNPDGPVEEGSSSYGSKSYSAPALVRSELPSYAVRTEPYQAVIRTSGY